MSGDEGVMSIVGAGGRPQSALPIGLQIGLQIGP
jgi:hypothetical protein